LLSPGTSALADGQKKVCRKKSPTVERTMERNDMVHECRVPIGHGKHALVRYYAACDKNWSGTTFTRPNEKQPALATKPSALATKPTALATKPSANSAAAAAVSSVPTQKTDVKDLKVETSHVQKPAGSAAAAAAAAGGLNENVADKLVLLSSGGLPMIRVYPRVINPAMSDRLFTGLDVAKSNWKRYPSVMPGQQQPRYVTSWTADVLTVPSYVYSRLTVPTLAYDTSPEIAEIAALLKGLGADVDYILGNLYEVANMREPRDLDKAKPLLDDSVDEHADDEPSIDQTRGIWSISLGGTRRFTIRVHNALAPNSTAGARLLMTIDMPDGFCFEMAPGFQSVAKHAVHKRSAEEKKLYPTTKKARINLTARKLKPK